jgi:hypothetical protein
MIIKLSNNTILEDVRLNGNNYVTNEVVTEETFKDGLNEVEVCDGDDVQVLKNQKLVQISKYGDENYFILVEKTKDELENEELKKKIADLTEIILLGGK